MEGQTNTNQLLQSSLKKINTMREENEHLESKLDAYKGHDEAVDKLREKEKVNQETIKHLQTQVSSMRGNENAVSKLNGIIQDLQLKNSQLNLQLMKYASK
jgi:DNA repair ATPase RecN